MLKQAIIKELKSQLEALKLIARIIGEFIRTILHGIVTFAFVVYLPMCIVWRFSGDFLDSELDFWMLIGLIILFGWITKVCYNVYLRYSEGNDHEER